MPIIDMNYVENENVIFVLISKNTIKQKVGGFLKNITGKSEICGKVIAFKASGLKKYEFNKLWEYEFSSPVLILKKIY